MNESERDNAGVIAPPPLIYLGTLLLGLLLNRRRPIALPPPLRGLARPFGWALLGAGLAGDVWFVLTMRRARTAINPTRQVTTIVTSGPFRFSRNPSYLCFTMIYVGVSAVRDTLWPLFALPGVLAAMRRGVIEREEAYLERAFGAEYTQYKARVRRWL